MRIYSVKTMLRFHYSIIQWQVYQAFARNSSKPFCDFRETANPTVWWGSPRWRRLELFCAVSCEVIYACVKHAWDGGGQHQSQTEEKHRSFCKGRVDLREKINKRKCFAVKWTRRFSWKCTGCRIPNQTSSISQDIVKKFSLFLYEIDALQLHRANKEQQGIGDKIEVISSSGSKMTYVKCFIVICCCFFYRLFWVVLQHRKYRRGDLRIFFLARKYKIFIQIKWKS